MHCGHVDELTASPPPGPVRLPTLPLTVPAVKRKESVANT